MSAASESGGEQDVVERLSLDEVRSGSLIAAEHLHRYELAASLCGGLRVADVCCGAGYGSALLAQRDASFVLGVDIDAETIAGAEKALASPPRLEFKRDDAIEFLERDLVDAFDVVVMFEGLEHVPDPQRAVAAIATHAKRGLRALVSIPNSVALGEVGNPFHVTDFDFESARSTLSTLSDNVVLLYQFAAEGSLIRAEESEGLDGDLVLPEHGEPRLCSHLIAAVNFDREPLERAGMAKMQLEVAPLNRRYMDELEAKVDQLWDELTETAAELRSKREELERIQRSVTFRAASPAHRMEQRLRARRRQGS